MEPVQKITSQVASITFTTAVSPGELEEIGRLRARVWQAEGVVVPDFCGSQPDCWLDSTDPTATHYIAFAGQRIVAAARLSFHEDSKTVPDYPWFEPMHRHLRAPCCSLNRLVVDAEFRGQGIARALDLARLRQARINGAKTAVVVAVGHKRVKALESLGFQLSHFFPAGHCLIEPEQPLGAMYLGL